MADAIVSVVVEQLLSTVKEQIQSEIKLVRGVDKELLHLSQELKNIRNVLDDADMKQFKDKSVKDWLWRLEQTSFQIEDVLDEWNYAILKHKMEHHSSHSASVPKNKKLSSLIPSSCLCFKKLVVRHDISKKIQNLKSRLDEILKEKDRYNFVVSQPRNDPSSPAASWRVQSTSLVDSAQVQGRNHDWNTLVSKLIANGGSDEELGFDILSIVGGGGLGKTTLAQLVYNDSRVKDCFKIRIWLCVSDPFDVAAIAKGIMERLPDATCPDTNQLDAILEALKGSISDKKIVLVLDDVWNEDEAKWEPLRNALKCCKAGSKILVTTRKVKVARMMGSVDEEIHRLGLLSDEDCWLLLRGSALCGRRESEFECFEEIGKEIAKKCSGLPLAAKTLGSLLRFKNSIDEWENVLKSEMWGLEHVEVELFPHLLLSYHELSPTLKRCFSFCAFFPKDNQLKVEKLIRIWMALGYVGADMELKGREYLDDLAMRSLFQDFEVDHSTKQITSCKMHDIVHDFAQFIRKNERVESNCQICNPFLISMVQEYRGLVWGKECPPNICDCLTSARVLRKANGSPHGMEKLIHLRWLDVSGSRLSMEEMESFCKLYLLETLVLARCSLKELPREIGNLVKLRKLDLSWNQELKELPESMSSLVELQNLEMEGCIGARLSQGVGELSGLRSLNLVMYVGSGWNKVGLLKNLNRLSGPLEFKIMLSSSSDVRELVEDVREGELRNKIHIHKFDLHFHDDREPPLSSSSSLMEALEPHHKLQCVKIRGYKGSRLPRWMSSPLNQVREIYVADCSEVRRLPPMGKLPLLEKVEVLGLMGLKVVGVEWLGIRRGGGGGCDVAFPKLKKLTFLMCGKWREWEDITAEEEESVALTLMPCLTELNISICHSLKMLPHRLLRKASCLRLLNIAHSFQLRKCYEQQHNAKLIPLHFNFRN